MNPRIPIVVLLASTFLALGASCGSSGTGPGLEEITDAAGSETFEAAVSEVADTIPPPDSALPDADLSDVPEPLDDLAVSDLPVATDPAGDVSPKNCTVDADCTAAGACPSGALKGCTCVEDKGSQKVCKPACSTDADCPQPPDKTLVCSSDGVCVPQQGGGDPAPDAAPDATAPGEDVGPGEAVDPDAVAHTVGLMLNTDKAYDGYTLMSPMHSTWTWLIDNAGQWVHKWNATGEPGRSSYLLENGHLIRASAVMSGGPSTGGGEGGLIQEFDWDGTLVWSFQYVSSTYIAHHDFKVLPNGNVLVLASEVKPWADVLAAGFDPARLDPAVASQGFLLPDYLVEVQPTLPSGGTVVWEWHMWDHIVQHFDATKSNYGVIADHPERIDPNVNGHNPQFWNHVNGIDYNPALDQVLLSVRNNNELFVIDHGTTTAQAAGHTGGARGKGGDILYRWGDPEQYGRGTHADETLWQQHHTHWIETGLPGAGNILIFNNGLGRGWSSVDQIVPPVNADGGYTLAAGAAFGPSSLAWTYVGSPPASFYSAEISGAHRLPNGNTLICEGVTGRLFEVTSAGEMVWEYVCPVTTAPLAQGSAIPADTAKAGQFMNAVFRVNRYGADYPGLQGKDLTPKGTIETY